MPDAVGSQFWSPRIGAVPFCIAAHRVVLGQASFEADKLEPRQDLARSPAAKTPPKLDFTGQRSREPRQQAEVLNARFRTDRCASVRLPKAGVEFLEGTFAKRAHCTRSLWEDRHHPGSGQRGSSQLHQFRLLSAPPTRTL